MLVHELMSTDVVACSEDATVREAVKRLLANDVGSVVIVDDEQLPAGILTETDVLKAGYQRDDPFSEMAVSEFGRGAVISASPDETVQRVARRMADEGVKKVPVLSDLDLVGILTLTDIVWNLQALRSEAAELTRGKEEWGPNR